MMTDNKGDFKRKNFDADDPIKDKKDDMLGRTRFAEDISSNLLNWESDKSIIIGINGVWGSGKSSVINLIKQCIKDKTVTDTDNKPVVIDFNPWILSKREDITKYFFNEIASAFDYKGKSEKDRILAERLRIYADLLGVLECVVSDDPVVSLPAKLLKSILRAKSEKYDRRSKSISVIDIKKELNNRLVENKRNIIVFIDDIDRLADEEIKEIFRLVRVNADFNKMIYVMAFDRKIVEKSFEGQKYLEKIVQVIFDIPFPSEKVLQKFLFEELYRVIKTLPSAQAYFNENKDENHWGRIVRSGFKDFFKTIRDIKRFMNGLEFNISRMRQKDEIEINPIDFIAVEAIRLFAHEFYLFMAHNLVLFTATHELEINTELRLSQEERKEKIENALESCTGKKGKYYQNVKGLIKELFPQLKDILEDINTEHNTRTWNKQLRICSEQYYKSYFNFIPGGEEEEISRYEMIKILKEADSMKNFEQILNQYMEIERIGKVLEGILDFIEDKKLIPERNVKNIIEALFNIYEDLPRIPDSAESIIYQLLSREKDREKNFNLLKELIPRTKGLYMQFLMTCSCKSAIPPDKIISLQKICVEKINNIDKVDKEYLINHKKLPALLNKWKKWSDSKQFNDFINRVLEDDKNTIVLIEKFISERTELIDGKIKKVRYVLYEELSNFVNLENVKIKLDEIKKSSPESYKKYGDTIDLFLKNYKSKSSS
ncbi:MAG: KAP family NTPase [Endomicrobium sp.]|nr:KAP family NTPase [Endomicrobium sp.]